MGVIVDVYATQNGEYLGKARYLDDVSIASVTQPDAQHCAYTALRNSGETTEKFEFIGEKKQVFYGFEYFVKFPQRVTN